MIKEDVGMEQSQEAPPQLNKNKSLLMMKLIFPSIHHHHRLTKICPRALQNYIKKIRYHFTPAPLTAALSLPLCQSFEARGERKINYVTH